MHYTTKIIIQQKNGKIKHFKRKQSGHCISLKNKKSSKVLFEKDLDSDLLIKYGVAKIRALEQYASLIAAVQGKVETTLGQTVPISIREKSKSCKQV